ncbi:hypothetical protein JHK87_031060 [Glycine soja]|nr:hypothetical protein JHK87_031060 [Glycine soja]
MGFSLMMASFFSFLTDENVKVLTAFRSGGLFYSTASLSCFFGLLISFFRFMAKRVIFVIVLNVEVLTAVRSGVVNKFFNPIGLVYKSRSLGRSLKLTKFTSYPELRNKLGHMFGHEG